MATLRNKMLLKMTEGWKARSLESNHFCLAHSDIQTALFWKLRPSYVILYDKDAMESE